MADGIDGQNATILYERYKNDGGGLNNNHGGRKPSHSNTPIKVEDAEKRWHSSSRKCDIRDLSLLIAENDELLNKKDFFMGYSTLHWAAKRGRIDVVDWLFEQNADMNLRTNGGYTALHIATIHNHDNLIKNLIHDFGADINARDYSGRKAKHYASRDLSRSVYKSLQGTTSIFDTPVYPDYSNYCYVSPNKLTSFKPYSTFPKTNMPIIHEYSLPESAKKKKKSVVIGATSFREKKRITVAKRSPNQRIGKGRKSLSVSDIGSIVSYVS